MDVGTVAFYAVCAGVIALAVRSIWRSLFVRSPAPAQAPAQPQAHAEKHGLGCGAQLLIAAAALFFVLWAISDAMTAGDWLRLWWRFG